MSAAAAAAAAARCPTDRCISAAVSQSVVEVAYQGDGRHAAATSHRAVSDCTCDPLSTQPPRLRDARLRHRTASSATRSVTVSFLFICLFIYLVKKTKDRYFSSMSQRLSLCREHKQVLKDERKQYN